MIVVQVAEPYQGEAQAQFISTTLSLKKRMSHISMPDILVLALYPSTRGFGFAIFKGPSRPIDWGVKDVRIDKNVSCLSKMKDLIEFYEPEVVVTEDYAEKRSRRCKRIQALLRNIARLVEEKRITNFRVPRATIRSFYSRFGARTKYERAKFISEQFPEFELQLPPPRRIWMSEDPRMSIFEAAALALMYWYGKEGEKKAA